MMLQAAWQPTALPKTTAEARGQGTTSCKALLAHRQAILVLAVADALAVFEHEAHAWPMRMGQALM